MAARGRSAAPTVAKVVAVARQELSSFHPRLWLAQTASAALPPFVGARLRTALLRFADDDAFRFHRWFKGLTSEDHLWLLAEADEPTRSGASEPLPRSRPPTRTSGFCVMFA